MRNFLRTLLKKILAFLTRKVIEKHNPSIIAIIGYGETSIARELITEVLNTNYPVRRNLETPEAEFSVPLTVFASKHYPNSYLGWLLIILKVSLQLVVLKQYYHFVLELDTVNHEIRDFWMDLLNPEMTVITGDSQKIVIPNGEYAVKREQNLLENYKKLAIKVGEHYDIDKYISEAILDGVKFPKARINFLPGKDDSTIIDATHYYFPISIKSAMELVDPYAEEVVVLTENEHDTEYILKHFKTNDVRINPENYKPRPGDFILLRGLRTQTIRKYWYLIER